MEKTWWRRVRRVNASVELDRNCERLDVCGGGVWWMWICRVLLALRSTGVLSRGIRKISEIVDGVSVACQKATSARPKTQGWDKWNEVWGERIGRENIHPLAPRLEDRIHMLKETFSLHTVQSWIELHEDLLTENVFFPHYTRRKKGFYYSTGSRHMSSNAADTVTATLGCSHDSPPLADNDRVITHHYVQSAIAYIIVIWICILSTYLQGSQNSAAMNTRPAIESSSNPVAFSASFNQDASCFSVGLDTGFCSTLLPLLPFGTYQKLIFCLSI